jgi:hypothetical protein
VRALHGACCAGLLVLSVSCLGAQTLTIRNAGVEVSFTRAGRYTVAGRSNALHLEGELPAAATDLRIAAGTDALGAYREIEATYGGSARTAVIRLYRQQSAVLFLDRHKGADANTAPFPKFDAVEPGLLHASYKVDAFSPVDFDKLDAQGPWLFFDRNLDAMVLSPADSFLVADMERAKDGRMQSGIDPRIETLPAGFTHRTLLTLGKGINGTLDAWGMEMQKLGHKPPVANDADVVLNKFGYWTDNGASYYYKFDPKLGYEGTLLAVRDKFRQLGVPIAYMQLDSWWYPKEKGYNAAGDNGATVYRADLTIFPDGLSGFHLRLGLPLATHARWISASSPYRKEYRMSRNVIVDPRYWNSTAEYLKKGGVVLYEQDWLNANARPAIDIAESHAFLAEMASGMARQGIVIQYCMALPGYFLASTQFPNVRTIRTSVDRFMRPRYDDFLYVSALAHAVGLWPWSDVFMSGELPNLVISTLSAGPVGTGDALGTIDAANLKRAMRADSVLLKPDTPLAPIDAMYLADAAASQAQPASPQPANPMIAATQTRFGSATETYVFSYPRRQDETGATVSLSDLGIGGPVYAWDWVARKGEPIPAGGTLAMRYRDGWSYEVLAPVNASGIALLGDTGKIVPLARKRFTAVSNRGAVEATIAFARGEKSVTVMGYAAHQPHIRALDGKAGDLRYDGATHLFSFTVSPNTRASARVRIL